MKSVLYYLVFILVRFCIFVNGESQYFLPNVAINSDGDETEENTPEFWKESAQSVLRNQILREINNNTAKNVIFFMGDGMSIATITAARIYQGQLKGQRGEEDQLSFEKFPYVGLSKTYCIDSQIADSACAATALFSGINGNFLTSGVDGRVAHNNCKKANEKANQVETIITWAQQAGKSTGIVTNTRITHASPAAAYSHSANRNFECDADVLTVKSVDDSIECHDIASQLILNEPGKHLNVTFGGGRGKFLPKHVRDEDDVNGQRLDGQNLINMWKEQHKNGRYVFDKKSLENVDLNGTEHVLGLFHSSHMSYVLDADSNKEPSLKEMTEAAIKLLSKESRGFFLFVEGGRIDQAHHDAWARRALEETVQFSKAIQTAVDLTNEKDTLIVVTSDHSHTMSISGYSKRGNDILGLATIVKSQDQLTYTTLSYANGPGSTLNLNTDRSRKDLAGKTFDKHYKYAGVVPIKETTHAGEDVAVFAQGPQSHLFTGVYHLNTIPDIMAYASCMGNGLKICKN